MKRLLMFIITVTAILVLFTPYSEAHADENDDYCELDEIKIASDEIDIDAMEIIEGNRAMNTVSDYTTYSLHASGVLQLYVKLDATFLYDGSSASCIANSASYNILNNDWVCDNLTSGRSGNQAWASFSFTNSNTGQTASGTIYISCSPSGVISKS